MPTSANIVVVPCKRTQQVTTLLGPTMLGVVGQQCWIRLHGPLRSLECRNKFTSRPGLVGNQTLLANTNSNSILVVRAPPRKRVLRYNCTFRATNLANTNSNSILVVRALPRKRVLRYNCTFRAADIAL